MLGETVLETIHQNLLTQEAVTDFYGANRWGKPVWELPVKSAPKIKRLLRMSPSRYLGRIVPLSRAIRLIDGGLSIILANGLDYPTFPAFREASATIINAKG